ncbi:MAG: preprotein translocase subunit SecG [Selenomonas sp.]|nr:preprotein translocase subunit SecG [Selenomonas sp.]
MESEREERKRSIRAARDWLAGAEDALAGADDVSGDLKLMLARAELACTTSTRRARLRRRARILLPGLAVIALALWGLWYAQVQEPAAVPAAVPASAEIEERAETPAAQSPVEEAPVPTPQVASAAPLSPHVTEGAETPAAAAQDIAPAAAPAVHESAAPPAAHAPASRLPSADMQHLMQVGGKILRE